MTARWMILGSALATVLAAGLTACTQASDATERTAAIEQGIIDGELAGDAYAAVGAIVTRSARPFPSTTVRCSGTLIANNAIVTARHCATALEKLQAQGTDVRFNIGQLAYAPDQSIPITHWVKAPGSPTHPGLLFDGGRDVAIAYLQHPPAQVTPAKLGEFTSDMLGEQFTIVGFGRDQNNFLGLRYAGPATARSLGGAWYPLLFNNNYGQFLTWYFDDAATENPSAQEASAWWSAYTLEPGFELLAGGLEGEALGCSGDSGGPLLLGNTPDTLTVYATGFAGEPSKSEVCTRGAGYLVHNQTMLGFLNSAL